MNVVADALSRVPRLLDGKGDDTTSEMTVSQFFDLSSRMSQDEHKQYEAYTMEVDDPELTECFLMHPDYKGSRLKYPLDFVAMSEQQQKDEDIQWHLANRPEQFQVLQVFGEQLACYLPDADSWRVILPTDTMDGVVQWYHVVLGHCGTTRLRDAMTKYFWHPALRETIEETVKTCEQCQREKRNQKGYGELPARQVESTPWDVLAVDLIGPWKVEVGGQVLTISALTVIDITTNLAELIRIDKKTAGHVAHKFEIGWLSRYPKPVRVIHDQGAEFKGFEFQAMLKRNGIKSSPTTVKNPQSNGICERMHQTVENTLRAIIRHKPALTAEEARQRVEYAIAIAQFAQRAAITRATNMAPGAMAFGRDMILNIPLLADLERIRERRQEIVDYNAARQNMKRISHDYQPKQKVVIIHKDADKLAESTSGPFEIEKVHVNGTVTLRIAPGITDRYNIRRIRPYHEPEEP